MDKLPYPIPGPAGTLPRPRPQSSAMMPAQPDRFSVLSWNQMQRSLSLPPYGSQRLAASLALLRRNALLNFRHSLSKLPVIVDSLHWVGHDASVTLIDPTASMSATIYSTVFASHPNTAVRAGTVLILSDVIAFAYSNRSVGFRADPSSAVHLNIRPPHIEAVIPVPDAVTPQQPSSVSSTNQSALYTSFAFAPQMPPVRPRRSPSFIPPPQQNPALHQPPTKPLLPHNRHPQPLIAAHRAPFVPPSKKRQFPNQNATPTSRSLANKRPALHHNHSSAPAPVVPASIPSKSMPTSSLKPHPKSLAVSNPNAVTAVSDDHLDSILGDFDLDAAIAAHEKSVPSEQPAAPKSHQTKVTSGVGVQHSQHSRGEHGNKPDSTYQSKPNSNDTPPASARTSSGQHPVNPSVPQVALSSVDDAMIQSLFDGLDASDFG